MDADGYFDITDFVRESNRIEGILRDPTEAEIAAHTILLGRPTLSVADIKVFVSVCAGKRHVLRDRLGLDVSVGNHIAPRGGPAIETALEILLQRVNDHPFPYAARRAHVEYETLHPFTDGNGRSGRAIWLWQMGGMLSAPLGFLHHFYYQSLEN